MNKANKLPILLVLSLFSVALVGQELSLFPDLTGSMYYQDSKQISRNNFDYLMSQVPEVDIYWKRAKAKKLHPM